MTRASFDAQRSGRPAHRQPGRGGRQDPRHSEVLGASPVLQMNVASLPQVKMMRAIDAVGRASCGVTSDGRRQVAWS